MVSVKFEAVLKWLNNAILFMKSDYKQRNIKNVFGI